MAKKLPRPMFGKAIRGYSPDDVDEYIKNIAVDYNKMAEEHENMLEKLEILATKLEEYRGDEEAMRIALMKVQRLAENTVRDARSKADIIIKDANIKAERAILEGKKEADREKRQLERLQTESTKFKNKMLGMYKSHIEYIANLPSIEIDELDPVKNSLKWLDPEFDAEPDGQQNRSGIDISLEDAGTPPQNPEANYPIGFEPSAPLFGDTKRIDHAQTAAVDEILETVEFDVATMSKPEEFQIRLDDKQPTSNLYEKPEDEAGELTEPSETPPKPALQSKPEPKPESEPQSKMPSAISKLGKLKFGPQYDLENDQTLH